MERAKKKEFSFFPFELQEEKKEQSDDRMSVGKHTYTTDLVGLIYSRE